MVDFRYHLVSIVAVFLALAVGIVVGTTALNGQLLDRLRGANSNLIEDKRRLEADVRTLRSQVAGTQQAARAVAPLVVAGRLAGQRVTILSTPDAPARLREDLVPLLTAAGASLGSQVRLQPALVDPASTAMLSDLVAGAAVPGHRLPDGEPVDQAMSQLAQVLVRRPGSPGPAADVVQRVLGAYTGEDLVDVDGEVGAPGTLAVLLTGTPEPATATDEGARAGRAVLGLARALDANGGGTVVAGPTAATQAGGLLQALRDDAGLSDEVASVDGADAPTGRTAVVLALQEQLFKRSGRYGTGAGADAALPELLPQ